MKKMESRITIISILVGIIGIAVTIYFSLIHHKPQQKNTITLPPQEEKIVETVTPPKLKVQGTKITPEIENQPKTSELIVAQLVISGTGADVTIRRAINNKTYHGGVVSATGAEQVIYLPKGQPLNIILSGTGADLHVSRNLMEQIDITNIGVGSDVSIF